MRKTAGALTLLLLTGFALRAQDANAAKQELAKLEGEWKVEKIEAGGISAMPDQLKELKSVTFKGNSFVSLAGAAKVEGTVRIDPTKRPKTLDLMFKSGQDKDAVFKAIYSLDGDEFKLCGSELGKDRPKDFDVKDKKNHTLMILKRSKS
jgi:uncharacterized protein (TIGR03067 family)